MKKRSPNEIGDDAEEHIKQVLGGERVPQSGGGKFFKLDNRTGLWVLSSKATEKEYIRITMDMFREAARAARGVRGSGDGVRTAVVTEIQRQLVVHLVVDDFADMLTGEVQPHIEPSKGQQRRLRARS